MSRPVTLFTGQWADLSLEVLARMAKEFGYDGLELACWGDHFDVNQAAGVSLPDFMAGKDPDPEAGAKYCHDKWQLLFDSGLDAFAISMHLVGQATCDVITPDHQAILPPDVWGKGVSVEPGEEGYDAAEAQAIRARSAAQMKISAYASRNFMNRKPPTENQWGRRPAKVNGFCGSPIWSKLYSFPPVSSQKIAAGFTFVGNTWVPILDVFDAQDVDHCLEVHPTEIAFDTNSARRSIEAVRGHKRWKFNYDPSHLGYQGVNYVGFIRAFPDRIGHVHMKDVQWGDGNGEVGTFGGHTEFADPARYWDFRSLGHGNINFDKIICALNDVGYDGPLSVEWEDKRMQREFGAREAAEFVRRINFTPSNVKFDQAFDNKAQAK